MGSGLQYKSWFRPYGHPKVRSLIAQVFFPTNRYDLDSNDREILKQLVDQYLILQLGHRIKFEFNGHADHRGNADYNKRLSAKRVKSVKDYVDNILGASSSYYSSISESYGEKYAHKTTLTGDRRVDIISSYVPPRPPMTLPDTVIKGRVPKKKVKRPVQFIDIARDPLLGEDNPHNSRPSWHTVIIEKYEMVDEDLAFPDGLKRLDHKIHGSFPFTRVHRYSVKWRKPQATDSWKKVFKVVLKILGGAFGTVKNWGTGPITDPNNPRYITYPSWQSYEARAKRSDRDFLKYKKNPFPK